jgi:hypothetical protein
MPLILDGTTGIVANNIADYAISTDKLANSAITVPKMGYAGALLKTQYFDVTPGTTISITTSSYTDFASITYTPARATSNILIFQNVQFRAERTAADGRFAMRMLVNGSAVFTLAEWGIYDYGNSGVWYNLNWPQLYVYSNTTGNNVAIKVQGHCDGRASSLSMYGADSTQGRSHIQVLEYAV